MIKMITEKVLIKVGVKVLKMIEVKVLIIGSNMV